MGFAEQLRILEAAKGSPALLALATVDLAHDTLPEAERMRIKDALLAAAVPHWCDRNILAALLQATPEETDRLFVNRRRTLTPPRSWSKYLAQFLNLPFSWNPIGVQG